VKTFLLSFLLLVPQAQEDVWTGVERVVAVGDVHGDCDQFVAVLQSAGVVDGQAKWSGGKTRLVQTGDVLDRGPDSRKAMDLLMRLEEEARSAGGEVHVLIGNHEAMNLYGDLRYVSAGEYEAFRDADSGKAREELYQEHQKQARGPFDDAYRKRWEADHPLGFAEHRREFGPSGKYGRWIRRHNAVVRIDDTLFLHGGISPVYADAGVRSINERIRAELADFTKLRGGLVEDEDGPLWYRGLALGDEKAMAPHVEKVARSYGVSRIVIGHTFTEGAVIPRFGGKVLMIDVGLARLYDPKLRMACLVIEKGKPHVLHRGKRLELPSEAGRDLLRYLKEAAALDPQPSPLARRISDLEARLAEK
jgi:hypothetical protein